MTNFLKKALWVLMLAYAHFAAAQTKADAIAAVQLDDFNKAVMIYENITKNDPTDQDAWLSLGNLYLHKGDKDKAKSAFDAAFNAKSDAPLAYVANARILLLQNNITEADKQLAKATKYGKKDMNVHRQIGESYMFYIPQGSQRPNYTRAIDLLKEALDVSSKDYPTLMSLAYVYKEVPNGGLAAQQYELAAQMQPKNPLPAFMVAKVYKTAKLPERFLIEVEKAISLDPTFTPALRAKAEHFYFSKKWAEALQAYKDLIAKGAEVVIEDEMQLANSLFINRDYNGAIELVEKIIKKDGSKNYLRRLLGYSYYETGDYPKGLGIMTEYFKMVSPEKILPSDYLYLGRLQVKTKGDTVAAIGNLKKAIDMDSTNWNLYKEMGDLYYGVKKTCEAAGAYISYLDSVPEPTPTDYYKLGLYQFYCKDDSMRYVKAEQSFAKVCELSPKATIGWLWRARAAAKLDPDPALFEAQPELINEFGKAKAFFETYISVATDVSKYKKDLISAYEYLVYHDFLKENNEGFNANLAKLFELDPNNETGKGLQEAVNSENGNRKAVTPTPNPGGGQKNK